VGAKKIKVHKKAIVKSIAGVKSARVQPKQIEVKKTQIVKQKPKSVVMPVPRRDMSKRQQDRITTKKTVEAVKHGNKKIVRLKGPKRDVNYGKIANLRNSGKDRILVMIACGPSVSENDFSPLKNVEPIDIMVINKPLESVWPPKYWAFCDNSQYKRNKDVFNQYGGTLINSNAVQGRKNNQIIVRAKATTGISRNLHDGYVIGRSSVYANIQTALWMNYDKIFIFGVDMCEVNGKMHHYGVNPDVEKNKRLERFKIEAENYKIMATKMPDQTREKIYFCSSYNPFDFTKKFNRMGHKEGFEYLLSLEQIHRS